VGTGMASATVWKRRATGPGRRLLPPSQLSSLRERVGTQHHDVVDDASTPK
jgi:hypothetical protein